MMETKRNLHAYLPDCVVAKAKEIGLNITKDAEIPCNITDDHSMPDTVGVLVGSKDPETGELIELDAVAGILQELIDAGVVERYGLVQRIENHLISVDHYFLIYHLKESSAERETYTGDAPVCGMLLNDGHYECEYEVLLADSGYTRHMVFTSKTKNVSMYEWLKDLTELIEEFDDCNYERYKDARKNFYRNEDGDLCFLMYDRIGQMEETVYEPDQFESMILSVRQLSCKYVEHEERA